MWVEATREEWWRRVTAFTPPWWTRRRARSACGDPDLVTFWRSGAKPFQALPLVLDGVTERFGMTQEELALCCASHSSEPRHVELVRELLGKIGCSERDLLCGLTPRCRIGWRRTTRPAACA